MKKGPRWKRLAGSCRRSAPDFCAIAGQGHFFSAASGWGGPTTSRTRAPPPRSSRPSASPRRPSDRRTPTRPAGGRSRGRPCRASGHRRGQAVKRTRTRSGRSTPTASANARPASTGRRRSTTAPTTPSSRPRRIRTCRGGGGSDAVRDDPPGRLLTRRHYRRQQTIRHAVCHWSPTLAEFGRPQHCIQIRRSAPLTTNASRNGSSWAWNLTTTSHHRSIVNVNARSGGRAEGRRWHAIVRFLLGTRRCTGRRRPGSLPFRAQSREQSGYATERSNQ